MKIKLFLFLTFLLITSCNNNKVFKIISPVNSGVEFRNDVKETQSLNILDYLYFYNGGGVSIGDIDNDGFVDIFLTSNQGPNKLYKNLGNLKFVDVSVSAGITGNSSWSTGSNMVDINNDGLLDIYICSVVGINGFFGNNELYINNGDLTFTESASKYNLDFQSYSSSTAFLDYDNDGDLDMYLLNHAIHTPESFGNVNLRNQRNMLTGDKLLRNDDGKFIDVSSESGIYGGVNGYGLGVSISDFNQDGFPDIFVGNDFHEDDYFYINNQDGTFSEKSRDYFNYSSRFSMGNDNADLNGDGFPEILSLDMLPEDEKVLKSTEGDYNFQIQNLITNQYGYHLQYTRNMLFKNNIDKKFSEIGLMSGVAATDWSWSSLFADFNQDGLQDLFISNGIPKRPNDLDFIKFVSSDQIRNKIDNTRLVDKEALELMPEGYAKNYFFEGSDGISFKNVSDSWVKQGKTVSGASAYGDLDNDGDLDLVVNNFNDFADIYINKTNKSKNYIKIKLKYLAKNIFGIGTKVYAYYNNSIGYKEMYTARGFQSSSEPIIHFGLGDIQKIDSLRIIWPNKKFKVLTNVTPNQTLEITYSYDDNDYLYFSKSNNEYLFQKNDNNLGIDFNHIEDNYTDFIRQKLIPFKFSDRGPASVVGDINNDGKQDIFFGGSKLLKSKFFLQGDSKFYEKDFSDIINDSISEDVSALIDDFNNDGMNDLLIGTGGADYSNKSLALKNNYYSSNGKELIKQNFTDTYNNNSTLISSDYDNDGDLDIFVGNHMITNDYGRIPNSYLLNNDKGIFNISSNLKDNKLGMVTDAIWTDFNNDGFQDLIIVGEWMSPIFIKNNNGNLKIVDMLDKNLSGLYQSIQEFDIDDDGDLDYLLGNWGLNSKFVADDNYPMYMYYDDFDSNGSTETIISINKNGKYYPIENLDNLSSQLVHLRKKFNNYKEFAGKTIDEVIDKEKLEESKIFMINNLKSGYLQNNGSKFDFVPFDNRLQVSPITSFLRYDFDSDNKDEVLVAGNYHGVKPFHGLLSSMNSYLIESNISIIDGANIGLNLIGKSVRNMNIIDFETNKYLIVTINDSEVEIYRIKKYD